MTDAEIEQERQRIEPPAGPLYVDSKAAERSLATFLDMAKTGVFAPITYEEAEAIMRDHEYAGDGTIVRPFLTLNEARDVQKPGQNIVISGYAVIGRAFGATPSIPQDIKERTE